jgi:hypothetical protein
LQKQSPEPHQQQQTSSWKNIAHGNRSFSITKASMNCKTTTITTTTTTTIAEHRKTIFNYSGQWIICHQPAFVISVGLPATGYGAL